MKATFRSLLQKEKPLIGCFAQLGSAAVIEIMAYCGYRFFIIDNEHGYMDSSENLPLIRACEAMGRVPRNRTETR